MGVPTSSHQETVQHFRLLTYFVNILNTDSYFSPCILIMQSLGTVKTMAHIIFDI